VWAAGLALLALMTAPHPAAAQTTEAPKIPVCHTHNPLRPSAPQWNGWGDGVENTRYQPDPGFNAAAIPRLKVKWAFAYEGTKNTEPLIFGDWLFVGSLGGDVYALDAATGCVHWRANFPGGVRASMSVGALASASSGYALYIAGVNKMVVALDAERGQLLWTAQVDTHPVGQLTGSPTLYEGLLYVPLSANEEAAGYFKAYGCCTFLGGVVALDAATGKQIWRRSVLDETPHPTRKNADGVQMYGPAGGAVWSAPTIDVARGQLYAATSNSYTEVPHPTSDAILALDLKTGAVRWTHQVRAADNFVLGDLNQPLGARGPDFGFGASPGLIRLASGRQILVAGEKSSTVYALDPATGAEVWRAKLGEGGQEGGILWGTASDAVRVYAPLNDPVATGHPGLVALDAASGKVIWRVAAPVAAACHIPHGACQRGFRQAVTAVPGAVFAGAHDGWLRAYAARDGHLLWAYDTTTPIDTVNDVKAATGGSLSMGGPTIAGGMMFVHSGYIGDAGANNLLLAFSVDGR